MERAFKGEMSVPRDREASFAPQLVRKLQRHLKSLDKKVIMLYAHGLSTSAIEARLEQQYGVDVSPTMG